MHLDGRAGIVVKELTMPPKFPGATRRDLTRNRVKGPKVSGATRRNPANGAKRPKVSGVTHITAFSAPLRGQRAHMDAMSQNADIPARR